MAFNIQNFSSKVSSLGVAKNNLFVVTLTTPRRLNNLSQATISTENLSFLCHSAVLPGIDLGVRTVRPDNLGTAQRRPNGVVDYNVIPLSFYVDEDFKVMKFFHKWMQGIVNYDASRGKFNSDNDRLPFEVSYKDDYVSTIMIDVYSGNSFEKKYSYKLNNAFPVSMNDVSLDWGNGAEVMKLGIGFSYDQLQASSSGFAGISENDNSNPFGIKVPDRANDVIDKLVRLGQGVGALTGSSEIPFAIQDTVNTLSRVQNFFSL
jgi:hypothetical protein